MCLTCGFHFRKTEGEEKDPKSKMEPSGEKSDMSGDKNSTAIQSSGGPDPRLSNNWSKCTLIERFDKTVRVITPSSNVKDFPDLENADKYIKRGLRDEREPHSTLSGCLTLLGHTRREPFQPLWLRYV